MYNYKPAMNGKIVTYGYYLESHFNTTLQRMIFYSSKTNKSRVYLDPDILNNSDHDNISIFIRMNILSNKLDRADYLSGLGSYPTYLFGIKFDDDSVFNFSHRLSASPVLLNNSFTSEFRLSYGTDPETVLLCNHNTINEQYFDLNFKYFNIQIIKNNFQNRMEFEIKSDHPCFNSKFSLTTSVAWQNTKQFIFGSIDAFILYENPFYYVFYDLQIFLNFTFIDSSSTEKLAFHGNRTQSVFCEDNEFLLRRYNNHPDIDSYFDSQNMKTLPCNQRKLNINCVTNCILCAGSTCLICNEFFHLDELNNQCIDKLSSILSGDYLIRFKKDISSTPQNLSNPGLVSVLVQIDHSSISTNSILNSETFAVQYNFFFNCIYFSLPEYSVNPVIKSLLATTSIEYMQLTLPEHNLPYPDMSFSTIPLISSSIIKKTTYPDCSVSQDFTSLYGSYPMLICPNVSIEFSSSSYMFDSLKDSSSSFQYNDNVEPYDFSIKLPCKNNCSCDKNTCLNSTNCGTGLYYKSTSLLESSNVSFGTCLSCPAECQTCEDGICTSCSNSEFQNFYLSNPSYGVSNFKYCANCDLFNNYCIEQFTPPDCSIVKSGQFLDKYSNLFRVCEFISCIPNCQVCSDSNSCDSCKNDFLFDNSSKSCLSKKSNCKNYNPVTQLCEECFIGYYLNIHSFCEKCSSNCEICSKNIDNNLICTTCKAQYSLISGKCINLPLSINHSSFSTEISPIHNYSCSSSNCLTCKNDHLCIECPPHFYLSTNVSENILNTCLPCPNDAISCVKNSNETLSILECADENFILNHKLTTCSLPIENCSLYNFERFDCKICKKNYFLNFPNKFCRKCNSNCLICDSFLGCIKCPLGTFLKNYECFDCPENCTQCYNENECFTCIPNFTLSSFKSNFFNF
jgi:hypothetical protein